MTQSVYTTGYTGKKPEDLLKVAQELDAIVFDIRFSPVSRNPVWNGRNVAKILEERYRHVGELGNRLYKSTKHEIDIVDIEAGRKAILEQNRPVILLCMCGDPTSCHRTFIAGYLKTFGLEVTEITLPDPKPEAPYVPQLSLF